MCEKPKEPTPATPGTAEIDVDAMIAITRAVAVSTVAEILADVLRAALIDDRDQRLAAVAELMTRLENPEQRAN